MLIGIDASRAARAHRTGTENYSLYLVRALARIAAGHSLRLYSDVPPPAGLLPDDASVAWRVMPFPRLWTHLRLSLEMALHPPDVLFVPAHVLPLVHPRASVVTVHDLGYLYYPEAHGRWARWYLDWGTRYSAQKARWVVVDSEATGRDLAAAYDIAASKIRVAYPAGADDVEPVTDRACIAETQARYGTGERYFLYIGTLQPRKNLESLIAAFGRLMAAGRIADDVRLVLVGKAGWLSEGIVAAGRDPALRGRVILTGYVPQEDLAALLTGAIAFCLPSWYEGFGLPVLEAMACDVPVICSNASSLPEVGQDAALLVDPASIEAIAEAMARVYQDGDLRREMVARGRRVLRSFNWDACARVVLRTLVDAAGGG